MKILVLGGTGAMGKYLVDILVHDGAEVIVTSRSRDGFQGSVRYVQGDAQQIEFLEEILYEKWDVIVDFMNYQTTVFADRVNLLLKATSHYVFLSSARVYASSKNPLEENSPRLLDTSEDREYLATDEYALSKARQEDILAQSDHRNWTIVRPYITYSEARLQLGVLEKEGWLYRALHGRTILVPRDVLSKNTTMTYGLDVAEGMKSLIGNTSAMGETFHITAAKPILWGDVLDIYLDVLESHLGNRPKVKLLELKEFLECHPAIYQAKYDRLFDRQFKNDKIGVYVDLDGFVVAKKGLHECLKQFLQHQRFLDINWRAEALKDRKVGEHTPLSEISGIKSKFKYLLFRYLWPNLNSSMSI